MSMRSYPRLRGMAALVISVILAASLVTDVALGGQPDQQPEAPLPAATQLPSAPERPALALYFPWYDPTVWESGVTSNQPCEPYWSGDGNTIKRQIGEAKKAGLDGFVSSYFGPGGNNPTDVNLQKLLEEAKNQNFKIGVMLETDSPEFFPTVDTQKEALSKVLNFYASHPAYLRIQGKPVIFVWRPRALRSAGGWDGARAVAAWRDVIAEMDPERKALWIAEGEYTGYLDVFDGMYPFSIAWSSDPAGQLQRYANEVRAYPGKLWFAIAMPGYNDLATGRRDAFVVDRQNGSYYRYTLSGALATNPDALVVVSYNEWVEGHAIEAGAAWGDLYLNITREAVDVWKRGGQWAAQDE